MVDMEIVSSRGILRDKLKQRWHWLLRWQYLGLFLLVLITLILHFSIIMQPGELVFDEQVHEVLANELNKGVLSWRKTANTKIYTTR